MSKGRWKFIAGCRPHTVTVYERSSPPMFDRFYLLPEAAQLFIDCRWLRHQAFRVSSNRYVLLTRPFFMVLGGRSFGD